MPNTDKKPTRHHGLNTEIRAHGVRRAGTLMYTFTHVDAGACRRGTWSDPAVHKPRQTRAHTHRNPPRPDTHSHPSQDLNSTAGLSIPTLGVTQGPG